MANFIQFHLLTAYGPSNPNRDDQGRPKQAMIGGAPRLRISSQSLKRALRESTFFALDLKGSLGTRTKRLMERIVDRLAEEGFEGAEAMSAAARVSGVFSKITQDRIDSEGEIQNTFQNAISDALSALDVDADIIEGVAPAAAGAAQVAWKKTMSKDDGKTKKRPETVEERLERIRAAVVKALEKGGIEKETAIAASASITDPDAGSSATTLAFISPDEWAEAERMALDIVGGGDPISEKDLKKKILRKADGAVDIAMFGRMLAADPDFNREAAVQVSHAVTTHAAQAEEDWFSAVDDLNKAGDMGASHLGESYFGSGIFYQYVCVNCDLLVENLGGNEEARALAEKGIEALARAIAQVTPKGKQSTFAHRPIAFHVRVERGTRAPRDLTGAFFTPVDRKLRDLGTNDLQTGSVKAMERMIEKIDGCYFNGKAEDFRVLDVLEGQGSLDEVASFAVGAIRGV